MKRPRQPVAYCFIRPEPPYRASAFCAGLTACGYRVLDRAHPTDAMPGDLVVTWNRYGQGEAAAITGEARGARTIVAENGYIGRDGDDRQFYALALDGHNGSGSWPSGDAVRLKAQTLEWLPWRDDGKHILVLPQRGIGPAGVGMPKDWTDLIMADLPRRTKRPIRLRPHPGRHAAPPLSRDLKGAWAVVTWGSGAAVKALAAGIPVFHALPRWVGAPAARLLTAGTDFEAPWLGDRSPMFEILSGAQASLAEIASGAAFHRLLEGVQCRG